MFGVCMCLFCLCCPVFRLRPCDELITRPRSPAVCKMIMKLKKRPGPKGAIEPVKKNLSFEILPRLSIFLGITEFSVFVHRPVV
jgi:hypothetical protein